MESVPCHREQNLAVWGCACHFNDGFGDRTPQPMVGATMTVVTLPGI